jgi:hypothetical protein
MLFQSRIVLYKLSILTFLFILPFKVILAQSLMSKSVSINAKNQRLDDVLSEISHKAGFQFSYNGKAVPNDSSVNVLANNQTVSNTLKQLFGDKYEYEERRNYIIITPALLRLSFVNTDVTTDNNNYSVSGLVVDVKTGERLMNTSVYEKEQLVSTLTDEHGYFKLKLRSSTLNQVRLTASRVSYRDTSLNLLNTVVISKRSRGRMFQNDGNDVEATSLGTLFTTAAQRIQSLNIQDFFAKRPFQLSITPGLSTHGLLTSQVINKFSLNIIGGYTAGVDGVELAGLFNINRGSSRYFQIAGIFNLVGGSLTGLQIAGVNNRALDSLKGVQVAGFINKSESQVSGLQLSAISNEARILKGVQIGLVNIADTSKGVSIGLINIIRNGFYRLSMSTSSVMMTNFSFTSGTADLYTIIHAGVDFGSRSPTYAMGIGLGHDFVFSKKFFASASINYQLMGADFRFNDKLIQGKLFLNTQISKKLSVFAGPVYNVYKPQWAETSVPYNGTFGPWNDAELVKNYKEKSLGWEVGIALRSAFKAAPKIKYDTQDWYIGLAGLGGIDIKSTERVFGTEFFMQRDFNGGVAATFSVGYMQHLARPRSDYYYWNPGTISMGYYDENNYKSIPIKAGMRSYTGKRLFFSGELGAQLGLNNPSEYVDQYKDGTETRAPYGKIPSSFIAGAETGLTFSNGLEASLKYDNYFGQDLQLIMFRLGYRFKL